MRSILLLICLLSVNSISWATAEFWLHGNGPGSSEYWMNGKCAGSATYWNDQGKQGPGSLHFWKNGTQVGSLNYWNYGDGPGSSYFWKNSTSDQAGNPEFELNGNQATFLRFDYNSKKMYLSMEAIEKSEENQKCRIENGETNY